MTSQTFRNLILAKKASAMLIAMGFAFVLILFGMGATKIVIRSLREVTNLEHSRYAFSAARAGLNHGLLAARKSEPGFEDSQSITLANGATVDWKIKARADQICDDGATPSCTTEYYIPLQGWGSAGENCDTVHPDRRSNSDEADDACNWGKIRVGETVTIPLYNDSRNFKEWVDSGLGQYELKIRTPCVDDACTDRYELKTDDDVPPTGEGDTLMTWEIAGECTPAEDCTMIAYDEWDAVRERRTLNNSEITEGKINNFVFGSRHDILDFYSLGTLGQDLNGKEGRIYYFLMNQNDTTYDGDWSSRTIDQPSFKMTLVHDLIDSSDNPIPYLEYQIVSDYEVTTPYNYIISEGFSGDFKQSLQIIQKLDTTILDFVIQN